MELLCLAWLGLAATDTADAVFYRAQAESAYKRVLLLRRVDSSPLSPDLKAALPALTGAAKP